MAAQVFFVSFLLAATEMVFASPANVPLNLTSVDIVNMNGIIDFLCSTLRQSPDIQGLFDPLVINQTIKISQIFLTIYQVEVVGVSHIRRITPALIYYDGRNITFSVTIAVELAQVSGDYKFGLEKRDTMTGHFVRLEVLVSLTVPFTGGGHPYCKTLEIVKIVGFKVSSGQNIIRYVANTRVTEQEMMAIVQDIGKGLVNKLLAKITLPAARKKRDEL